MVALDKIGLYRMTHIDNISHILKYGITHKASPNANPHFVSIGDRSLISTRNSFKLDNGKSIGEYIPFYFAKRTPMLYVIQNGFNGVPCTPAEDIIYCVTTVKNVLDTSLDFIFTDGHAVDSFSTQYTLLDIPQIEKLIDWNAVKATYWRSDTDLDLKRRKEAEFLVLGDISYTAILGFVVFNEEAKEKLLEKGIKESQIKIKPNYYF